MNALNTRNVRGNGLFSTLHTTKNCLMGLGVSLGIAIALPNSAEAAALSYAYTYQEIRGFNISGLGGTGVTFQPVTTSRAIVNDLDSGSLTNATDAVQAISSQPTQAGLAENFGFFPGATANYFDTQYRTQGGVADFSRGDSIIGIDDSGLRAVINTTELTNAILGGPNNLVFAGVAESLVSAPGTVDVGNDFRQDVGNAVGSYTITSSDFNVTGTGNMVTFDFDYLNAISNELTDPTPTGAPNTNLTQARYRFEITINEVDSMGSLVDTVYTYSSAPTDNVQSFNNPINIAPFGLTDTALVDNVTVFNFPLFASLTTNLDELTNDNSYRITISSEQIVDTRVLTTPEIPEPRTIISLIGLGFLGIVKKSK
ncbi:MAG: hypothetical protein MK111_26385 [Crocosphaera sp.]|uniref:hypothetical protein n=1 Tax=Crocosphaera sp. TaxID=2729996 RepID=UPI0025868EAF|nr:hypothetical protein [Crocosphaera sp.]MCH2248109.1 hypothetical protein [Crocosphaera sp.]